MLFLNQSCLDVQWNAQVHLTGHFQNVRAFVIFWLSLVWMYIEMHLCISMFIFRMFAHLWQNAICDSVFVLILILLINHYCPVKCTCAFDWTFSEYLCTCNKMLFWPRSCFDYTCACWCTISMTNTFVSRTSSSLTYRFKLQYSIFSSKSLYQLRQCLRHRCIECTH